MEYQLNKWTRPQYYIGAEWPEWYVGLGQNRDSGALDRSNFQSFLDELGESHCLCGWVEWIGIHESDTTALSSASTMMERLNDYPVLDESNFSETEDSDCAQTWENCFDESERVAYFRKHSWSNYPFPGETKLSMLRKAIKGDWSRAANLLHCPTDLLY